MALWPKLVSGFLLISSLRLVVDGQSGTGATGCPSTPCQNGGSCLGTTCSCPVGLSGQFCELLTDCNTAPQLCRNGTCNELTGECQCQTGYTGMFCESVIPPPSPCKTDSCGNGGLCIPVSSDQFICNCTGGFSGERCLVQDYCFGSPCANGGTCIQRRTSYSCRCANSYQGRNCTEIDPCYVRNCTNGVCILQEQKVGPLVAVCRCPPGFVGDQCELDENECQTGNGGCLNGGTCINLNFTFTCECPPRVSGQYCEFDENGTRTDLCQSNPCENSASCVTDRPWRFRCICQPGWAGDYCETASCKKEMVEPYGYEYEYEEYGDFGRPNGPKIPDLHYVPQDYAYMISQDYCLFGGKCDIRDSTLLPSCVCPTGYRGTRCGERYTVIFGVAPKIGPVSGGTDIYITGVNLNSTQRPQVSIGNSQCLGPMSNNSLIVCTTPPANTTLIDEPQNITIRWDRTNRLIDIPQTFTYMKDPVITKVEPLSSIISGGVTLTITGEGFNVIGESTLEITLVYNGEPVYVFHSSCTIRNSSTMLCPTPELEILDEDGQFSLSALPPVTPPPPRVLPPVFPIGPARRKKRHASGLPLAVEQPLMDLLSGRTRIRRQTGPGMQSVQFQVNNGTLEFLIGFRLDGVQTYRNLTEVLPEYSKLSVYIDPDVHVWEKEQVVTRQNRILEVQGTRLTTGIRSSDYSMFIGLSECDSIQVLTNKLICNAPLETPTPHPDDNNFLVVRVNTGVLKDPFYVGRVSYKTGFFDNPAALWGIVGAAIAVVVILIIIGAICLAKRTARF